MSNLIAFSKYNTLHSHVFLKKEIRELEQSYAQNKRDYAIMLRTFAIADNTFLREVQAYDAEIVALELQLHTRRAESENRALRTRFQASPQSRVDERFVYYSIAKLLFSCGQCSNTSLFDRAARAYQRHDFDELLTCYELVAQSLTPLSAPVSGAVTPETRLEELWRRRRYLSTALAHLEAKKRELKQNPVFAAWMQGPADFERICQEAIARRQRRIKGLKEGCQIQNLLPTGAQHEDHSS